MRKLQRISRPIGHTDRAVSERMCGVRRRLLDGLSRRRSAAVQRTLRGKQGGFDCVEAMNQKLEFGHKCRGEDDRRRQVEVGLEVADRAVDWRVGRGRVAVGRAPRRTQRAIRLLDRSLSIPIHRSGLARRERNDPPAVRRDKYHEKTHHPEQGGDAEPTRCKKMSHGADRLAKASSKSNRHRGGGRTLQSLPP